MRVLYLADTYRPSRTACANRRAVHVAHIVLNDQHRTDTALFRPDHRPQIRVIDIASLY